MGSALGCDYRNTGRALLPLGAGVVDKPRWIVAGPRPRERDSSRATKPPAHRHWIAPRSVSAALGCFPQLYCCSARRVSWGPARSGVAPTHGAAEFRATRPRSLIAISSRLLPESGGDPAEFHSNGSADTGVYQD